MNRHVEILAPAGSYESLRAAVCAGADAVYIGGMQFGARAYAKNLTQEELEEAIDYVHIHGRKVYLTVNTLLKDKEIDQLYEYLKPYYERGLDGVIVQDVGAASYIREYFPGLAVHASTQMTITGRRGASFMKSQGIVRVVPARELSLEEIRIMKEETGLEVECFVHGALCYCYSGQCLLSSMIGGRSGNRGQCAQPCRLPYSVEGGRPCDLMSLKDLCTIDLLPELMEAGIDSFKIEGRMKQPDYVYTVTSLYRKYADLYCRKGRAGYQVSAEDRERLLGAYQRRGYSEGYYRQHNGKEMISFRRPPGREEEIETCPDYKIQEKINGKLILSLGQSARLILEYKTYRIECEGPKPEPAMRQPLQASRVEQQMRKTGNTQFAFERMESVHGRRLVPADAGAQRAAKRRTCGLVRSRAVGLPQKGKEDARSEGRGSVVQGKNALWGSQAREAIENLAARSLGPLLKPAEGGSGMQGCRMHLCRSAAAGDKRGGEDDPVGSFREKALFCHALYIP
ncbi:MAG: peptidase U32 family protein [[Clostridium] scindens]